MAKSLLRIEARKLRSKGESIKVIAKLLSVSPSSVSSWCSDVSLTPLQVKELQRRATDPNYGNRLKNSIKQRQIRLNNISTLNKAGIKELGKLSKRELFVVGVALYWAEGFKKDSQAGLASSDPFMIKLFINWLQMCFNYSQNDLSFRVTVNISHQYRIHEIQDFWSETLSVPPDNFQKPFFQNVKWQKVYENPNNYYGVLRVKVRKSTALLRKIHGYIEGMRLNSLN